MQVIKPAARLGILRDRLQQAAERGDKVCSHELFLGLGLGFKRVRSAY